MNPIPVLTLRRERFEIPLASIVAIRPFRLPLPGPGIRMKRGNADGAITITLGGASTGLPTDAQGTTIVMTPNVNSLRDGSSLAIPAQYNPPQGPISKLRVDLQNAAEALHRHYDVYAFRIGRPEEIWLVDFKTDRVAAGEFREDLLYRLRVIHIHVPPLRERRDDIPMLVRHLVQAYASEANLRPKQFTDEALERMQRMDWPGNVRELRNTVERLMILAGGATVTADDVELLVAGRMKGGGLSGDLLGCNTFAEFKEAAERAFILQKLRENDWNVSETARLLDMPRSNLYKKIERYELVREG